MADFDMPDYYIPEPGRAKKMQMWLLLVFRKRKIAYLGSMFLVVAAAYWVNNWSAPFIFALIYWVVLKIIRSYQKRGGVFIIEARLQGEIITHCAYYQKPIMVPNSGLKIHILPKSRMKDVIKYGDDTQTVSTTNLIVVDYFEARENGDILMVFPRDSNFSNFALFSRFNRDLEEAMREIGSARQANGDFKEVVIQMFHEGKLGKTPQEALKRLQSLLAEHDKLESKLGNTHAAQRNIWLYYKQVIPQMHKQLLLLEQELPRLAMAEASKFVHQVFNHPMSTDVHEKIQDLLTPAEEYDYEERVRKLRKAKQVNATEADQPRPSLVRDEGTLVRP